VIEVIGIIAEKSRRHKIFEPDCGIGQIKRNKEE
jgi:hypothetical protein